MCRRYIVVIASALLIVKPPYHVSSKSVSNTWINLKTDDKITSKGVMVFVTAAVLNGGVGRSRTPNVEFESEGDFKNNYRASFVPLISVIANYLPKFLKRLKTQQVTSARSLSWLLTDEVVCTMKHLGRFPNPDNQCQFFECAMNLRNIMNCSYTSYPFDKMEENTIKPLTEVIQLKSRMEIDGKGETTSIAVMYKVDKCVSLILHQCSPTHAYSNRLQKCVPYNNPPQCPD